MKLIFLIFVDVIFDVVKEVYNIGDSVLVMILISEGLEMEVFVSNIFVEEWVLELERCYDDLFENIDYIFLNENEEEIWSEICFWLEL